MIFRISRLAPTMARSSYLRLTLLTFLISAGVQGITIKPALAAAAQTQPADEQATPSPVRHKSASTSHLGEQKFKANCSRCHTAPQQISPRIAGTVLRHMRVRASLSADDERDILHYLAP